MEKFCHGQDVAMTHAMNFKTVAEADLTFNYNICLHVVYLIDDKKNPVSNSERVRPRYVYMYVVGKTCPRGVSMYDLHWLGTAG